MISSEICRNIAVETESKILMLIIDGLGGLPMENGLTELEAAETPNLDEIAKAGAAGLNLPIATGVTPGSGPAHFSLFGYDPLKHDIGRGALAALGVGFDLKGGDVAARINFCTVDDNGNVADRRAGRISTEECTRLAGMLDEKIDMQGVEVSVIPVKEHRAVVIFRGAGLSERISDTDPQATGVPPKDAQATSADGEKTAQLANRFVGRAREILSSEDPANMVLLRGFAECPTLAPMREAYKLKTAAIATYPDYRGMAKVVGMDVIDTGTEIAEEIETLEKIWADYTFVFLHVKKTDSYGEDGNSEGKIHVIEEVDKLMPRIMALEPDVLIVTGDHSTPTQMKLHSYHPVPLMFHGEYVRRDGVEKFGETACAGGSLGILPGTEIMSLAMAFAGKLEKYGA